MSLTPTKIWIAGEVLSAADLNAALAQIFDNALTLISPLTGNLDFNGNAMIIDADGDLTLVESADDIAAIRIGATDLIKFDASTASSVNGPALISAATGNPAIVAAQGSDTNVGLALRGKGTGTMRVQNAAGSTNLFVVDAGVASAVNGLTLTSAITAGSPSIAATGTDSDINLELTPKGTGDVTIGGVSVSDFVDGSLWNAVINGQFGFWQRFGTTVTSTGGANNDDTIFCDRFWVLSNGNDVVDLTRETSTVPDRAKSALKCDIETGNLKFGILTILEARDAQRFHNAGASFSFEARKTGSSFTAIRAAIVTWTSTADAVTSDIVSSWNGAGSNPTLATNWAYVNTPAAMTALTTSYQTYKIEGQQISTTANNLGLFVWLDDTTTTVGDFLYLANWQFTRSTHSHSYFPPDPATELMRTMRYFEKAFALDTAPADGGSTYIGSLRLVTTTALVPTYWWKYSVPKRVTGTITMYNPRTGGTAGQWTSTAADLANARSIQGDEFGVSIDNTSTVASASGQWLIAATSDAEL